MHPGPELQTRLSAAAARRQVAEQASRLSLQAEIGRVQQQLQRVRAPGARGTFCVCLSVELSVSEILLVLI
jgi:hypothetical protein